METIGKSSTSTSPAVFTVRATEARVRVYLLLVGVDWDGAMQRAHDVLQHQPPPPGEERRAWLDKLLKNIIE